MKTLVKRALLLHWRWAYYKLFTLRILFYQLQEDYAKVNAILDEPIRLRQK